MGRLQQHGLQPDSEGSERWHVGRAVYLPGKDSTAREFSASAQLVSVAAGSTYRAWASVSTPTGPQSTRTRSVGIALREHTATGQIVPGQEGVARIELGDGYRKVEASRTIEAGSQLNVYVFQTNALDGDTSA